MRQREKQGFRGVVAAVIGVLVLLGVAAVAQAQQPERPGEKLGSVVSCTSFFRFRAAVDITEGLQTEDCRAPQPFDPQVFTFTNPATRGSPLLSGPAALPPVPIQQILQIMLIGPPPSPVEPTAFTTAAPPPGTPAVPSTFGADTATTQPAPVQQPAHAAQ